MKILLRYTSRGIMLLNILGSRKSIVLIRCNNVNPSFSFPSWDLDLVVRMLTLREDYSRLYTFKRLFLWGFWPAITESKNLDQLVFLLRMSPPTMSSFGLIRNSAAKPRQMVLIHLPLWFRSFQRFLRFVLLDFFITTSVLLKVYVKRKHSMS